MRRLVLLVLLAATACEVAEPPTDPWVRPDPSAPNLSVTRGSGMGKVLASTHAGELVEIDLDAGTATLIGTAEGLGWSDIAFDGSGDLFALSLRAMEPDFQVHLRRIDPSTGAHLADVGALDGFRFSDFDWGGDAFYGSGRQTQGSGGQLFKIDGSNAQASWIGSGFGSNPFSGGVIGSGGFAVHPLTGDLWGIEALQGTEPVLFRIDRSTGVADSILRLGLGGAPAPQQIGFDGLHIFDDSTFIATRGGFLAADADSALWKMSSVPDPVSGLAEMAMIPLVVDPSIQGGLNGLAPAPVDGALAIEVECDDLAPVRTALIACTVMVNTPDTVSFEWVFHPDSIAVFPGQDAPRFMPSDPVPGPSGPGEDSWGGQIVTSGWIVVVGATAAPDSARDSVHVAVQPRMGLEWETTETIVGPIPIDSLTEANHPEVGTFAAGRNRHPDGTLAFEWSGAGGDPSLIADEGPNHGYIFMDSAGYQWNRSYWINPHFMPTGPVHSIAGEGRTNHWNALLAMTDSMASQQALLDGVTAHETYGSGEGTAGHQGRMRDGIDGERCGNINRLMERIVGDAATFEMAVTQAVEESKLYLLTETAETNVGNNYVDVDILIGTNPDQPSGNGPHAPAIAPGDFKSFTHPPHSPRCN